MEERRDGTVGRQGAGGFRVDELLDFEHVWAAGVLAAPQAVNESCPGARSSRISPAMIFCDGRTSSATKRGVRAAIDRAGGAVIAHQHYAETVKMGDWRRQTVLL